MRAKTGHATRRFLQLALFHLIPSSGFSYQGLIQIHFTQLLNKCKWAIKLGVNSCGINKHLKSFNCKSSQLQICIFLRRAGERSAGSNRRNKTKTEPTEERQQEIACLVLLLPVASILMPEITLNYKHYTRGSCSLFRNQPIPITFVWVKKSQVWTNALRDTHANVYFHFDTPHIETLINYTWKLILKRKFYWKQPIRNIQGFRQKMEHFSLNDAEIVDDSNIWLPVSLIIRVSLTNTATFACRGCIIIILWWKESI